ncbi:hypothetical protein ACU8KH_02505 [Lachancea thermotolerans]
MSDTYKTISATMYLKGPLPCEGNVIATTLLELILDGRDFGIVYQSYITLAYVVIVSH